MDLSISIVSYNQLANLSKCVSSLQRHIDGISYEIIVVAYRFNSENLLSLRKGFAAVKIIESNEIRGFAENQNLALKRAQGKYCLILNDDTFVLENMVKTMMKTFEAVPDAGLVSPLILNPDLSVQLCGRGRYRLLNWFLPEKSGMNARAKLKEKKTILRTGAVSGSCFMAPRALLRNIGFFCEDYFFCPEDCALSIEVEKRGYSIYVNTAAKIVHQHGAASVPIYDVIWPVAIQGNLLFVGRRYNRIVEMILRLYVLTKHLAIYLYLLISRRKDKDILLDACKNAATYSFSFMPPKVLFKKLATRKGIL